MGLALEDGSGAEVSVAWWGCVMTCHCRVTHHIQTLVSRMRQHLVTWRVSFTWPYFIHHVVDPRFLRQTASYDVAGITHQTLARHPSHYTPTCLELNSI